MHPQMPLSHYCKESQRHPSSATMSAGLAFQAAVGMKLKNVEFKAMPFCPQ
jgi:hypothetical protein